MPIQLYKPGKTCEKNGIEFDFVNTNIGSLNHFLEEGWYKTIGEWIEPEEEEKEKGGDDDEEIIVPEPKTNISGLKPDEIRQLAETANIEDFKKKRITTLIEELNGIENSSDK